MPRTPTSENSPSPAALRLDNQVCFALYSASLAADQAVQAPAGRHRADLPAVPGHAGAVGAGRHHRLGTGRAPVPGFGHAHPLLKRLEASGHIRRTRDAQDERRVRIALTPQGLGLRDQAERIPHCVLESSQCTLPSWWR